MRLTTLLLLISLNCFSQTVRNVYCAEYGTFYHTSTDRLILNKYNGSTYAAADMGFIVAEGAGIQYGIITTTPSGGVKYVDRDGVVTTISTDEYGRTITGATKPFGLWQAYGYIKGDSAFVGGQDILNINGGATITAPKRLNNPSGRVIKKIVTASTNKDVLLVLCTDGTVWRYTSAGGRTPSQVTGFTDSITDVATIGQAAYVAVSLTKIYTWSEAFFNTYLGVSNVTTPTDITASWTSVGLQFPLKQVIGNYYALHIIDANNNWFTAGQDMNGETSLGSEYPIWRTYTSQAGALQPFRDAIDRNRRIISPTQVKGAKVDTLYMGMTYTFYGYGKDMADSLFSWGRNKTQSLGNGITTSDSCQERYNAACNVPAPRYVNPLYTSWTFKYGGSKGGVVGFNPSTPLPPLANAGLNQYITSSSTTLYGQGSSQQEFSITAYKWTKPSGGAATITCDTCMNTTVTGLTNGTYTFQLRVTNSNGAKDSITVKVVVDIPNSGCQINQSAVPNVNYSYKCVVDLCDTVKYVRVYYSLDGKNYTLRTTGLSNTVQCSIAVKKKDPLWVRADIELKNGKKYSKQEIF